MAKLAKKKASTKKKSAAEKKQQTIKRAQRRAVRAIFENAGFDRIGELSDRQLTFQGVTSDFDDVFLAENVLVLVEYTVSNESQVSTHLKSKKGFFDKVLNAKADFYKFISGAYPGAKAKGIFEPHHIEVRILYCSHYSVSSSAKNAVGDILYFDDNIVRYFKHLADVVKLSAKFEFLNFLDVAHDRYGEAVVLPHGTDAKPYNGSVLPETHSKFPDGYKVVSFYVDPAALLERAYVLRRDGWRDTEALYQRIISRKKIESIRKYLLEKKRVFINNIIVTLDSDTKIENEHGHTVDPKTLKKTGAVVVRIPRKYNSIGIIDGQHRIFSYYEGGDDESEMSKLRIQQNLLATGIVYPNSVSADERVRFEATLFLEINATQTNAKSDLKQAIGLLIAPFDSASIARQVVNALNDKDGPLTDQFQRHFFEKGRMKTTSVVSYGVKPMVRPDGVHGLFDLWSNPQKDEMLSKQDDTLRTEYIEFCTGKIETFLKAARMNLPKELWTSDPEVKERVLTPSALNVLLVCMRHAIEQGIDIDHASLSKKLKGLDPKTLRSARSSQYTKVGKALFEKMFHKLPPS